MQKKSLKKLSEFLIRIKMATSQLVRSVDLSFLFVF